MPKIAAPTLAAHREMRRQQIVTAAAQLALEMDGRAITMSAVAARAGISRTAIYEYFASSTDLLADLIIDELRQLALSLEAIVNDAHTPEEKVAAWIRGALAFVADGRHLLVKALSAVSMPLERTGEITAAHRALVTPLVATMTQMRVADPVAAAFLVNSAVESATKRIEQGANAESEIDITVQFASAGIQSLAPARSS